MKNKRHNKNKEIKELLIIKIKKNINKKIYI